MVGFRIYSLKVTPLRSVVIGEVELSQDEPSLVDLTVLPVEPTPTKVSFPKVTPLREYDNNGVFTLLKEVPLSVDLPVLPASLTPTKVLFPKVTPLLVPT